jgi:hypothetical protein
MRSLRHPSLDGPPSTQRVAGFAAEQVDAAAAILGADHPLVGLLRATRTTVDQAVAIAAAQAAGVGLLLTYHPWGLELLIAGTMAQLALGLRLLVLIETRHDVCRDLIIEDHAARGVLVLERERHRLAAANRRQRLAHSFEELAATAARPLPRVPASRPYFNVRVVRPFVGELREVGLLLRSDAASVRGVALAERLLTFPGSPLWGAEAVALTEELARIKSLLAQPPHRALDRGAELARNSPESRRESLTSFRATNPG